MISTCKECNKTFITNRSKRKFCSRRCAAQNHGPNKIIDIQNQKFGMLTAIKPIGPQKDRHIIWLCKCDCGKFCEKTGNDLRQGKIQSCGCNTGNLISQKITKHGALKDRTKKRSKWPRLYNIWVGIRKRCFNENCRGYQYYGSKGISICDEWSSYSNFKKWALSAGYQPSLTIDRIDSHQGYFPQNCQWITHSENCRKAQLERYKRKDGH